MSTEEWRPVPGYEGSYEVSRLGRTRSLARVDSAGRYVRGCVLSPDVKPGGYLQVSLWQGGQRKWAYVHRLVLTAFVGPPPVGAEARHVDGDPTNNAVTNLRWGTHSENQRDQLRHGTHMNARKTHCIRGHAFDSANTYVPAPGRRVCRTCKRDHQRNIRQHLKEQT